jgi:hypothetical protein
MCQKEILVPTGVFLLTGVPTVAIVQNMPGKYCRMC